MSNLSKIYYLIKTLDNTNIKIAEYEIAQKLEDDAYGRLWYEEKIDELTKNVDKIKKLLIDIVSQL